MSASGEKMPLQFAKSKQYIIYCARNLRTGAVKWNYVVNESLLIRLRNSGEWKLTGVREDDGFRQNTLDC